MELNLLKENDPLLNQISEAWDFEVDGDPTELVKEMSTLMFVSEGIGLAAPQCGVFKRIFVMGNKDNLVACINPEIIATKGEPEVYLEGCLSFPGLWLNIKRVPEVKVRYQNVSGAIIEEELSGIRARVFLHEFDHLIGVTFDERSSALGLQMAKERRKKKDKKLRNLLN
jgi:peptide deformylase